MSLRLRSFVIILITFLVSGITFAFGSPPELVNAGEASTSVTVRFTVQETASGTVDQIEGGEVELATETGATASVSFPPGAVTASTDVSISSIIEANIVLITPIPAGLNVVSGLVYDFKAEANGQTITTFDQPVTLTFAYTDAQISGLNESSVRVYYWDTTQEDWIIFSDYTLDTTNNIITINTSHFTLFAIMASLSSSPPGGGGGGGGGLVPSTPTFDASLVDGGFTYLTSKLFYGTKSTTADAVYVNTSNVGVTYPTSSRWQKTVSLALGEGTVTVKATNAYGSSGSIVLTYTRRMIGDINQDGSVNDYDLSLFVIRWGQDWPSADFNEDGIVDDYELSLMVAYWTG